MTFVKVEDEMKKEEDPKDSQVLVVGEEQGMLIPPIGTNMNSPKHTPLPSWREASLYLSNPLIQIFDLGDGGSSKEESTEFDEAI